MIDLIVLNKCNRHWEVLFTRQFVKASISSSGRSVRVLSCSTVLEGIAQVIGGSQRLLSLLLRSGVQIEPLCLHTEPILSLMVSNNLENYCLDKTKCSRGDWVGKDGLMCPWVLTLPLPEWERDVSMSSDPSCGTR